MKLMTGVLAVALAASASMAQNKPAPANTPANATKGTPASNAGKAATPAAKPVAVSKPTSAPQVKPVAAVVRPKPEKAVKPKAAAKPAEKKVEKPQDKAAASTGDVANQEKKTISLASKRDPFVSVIVERGPEGTCTGGGKKCLAPDRVMLRGIVRSGSSNIAVVVNSENRAYFLRENDPVLNGVVLRITDTSITFRERSSDIFGRPVTREVVKKINTPAV